MIWYLFEGKILKQGSCQPPLEFKKVLDFFVNYFIEHLEEITSDEVMKKVFDAGALEAEDAQAGNFVNWEEYNRFVGKEDNLPSSEDDFDPDPSSSLTPEQQNKRIKVWKKRYYKMEPFINRGLVDMEKYLKKINVSPPKLVSFGVDRITSS